MVLADLTKAKRIVVKVGTSTLTHPSGRINYRNMEHLVRVLADLKNLGYDVVLVSSGAIGIGMGKLKMESRPSDIAAKQAIAAVGQCELMGIYDKLFSEYNHIVAQVLLTLDIINGDKVKKQNVINTFENLFKVGAIPVVNENDTVSTDEIDMGGTFGDNDTLSALVALLVKADVLVLLTDIDGLFTDNPCVNPNAKLIPVVKRIDYRIKQIAGDVGSSRGTGGMVTKVKAAEMVTSKGIPMVIINGETPELLYDILKGKQVGTIFEAHELNT